MEKKKIGSFYSIFLILAFLMFAFGLIFSNSSIFNDINDSGNAPIQWSMMWGGNNYDWGSGVSLDSSGNAYVVGQTYSFGAGSCDLCLVKFNSNGNVEWSTTWGGISHDSGRAIAIDSSGYVYVAGFTHSFGAGNYDVCLLKFNSTGSIIWNITWGEKYSDYGYGIALDSSGNIYISGGTTSFGVANEDLLLVKFNSSGSVEWYNTWGGSYLDKGEAITLDISGNAYVAGRTNSFGAGSYDLCLVKFNSNGGVEWSNVWGGSEYDLGRGVSVDSSGYTYVTGYTKSFGASSYGLCLVKFNSSGGVEWNKTWRGGHDDEGYGIAMDSLGNAYVTGISYSFTSGGYNRDICLVKFNSNGDVEWSYTWGRSSVNVGYGIAIDSSGSIYIAGKTVSSKFPGYFDLCLVKFKDNFAPVWDQVLVDQTSVFRTPFIYDVSASDPSGIDIYWVNDTYKFQVDRNGIISNSSILYVGIYWLEINVNDTFGNVNTKTIKITIYLPNIQGIGLAGYDSFLVFGIIIAISTLTTLAILIVIITILLVKKKNKAKRKENELLPQILESLSELITEVKGLKEVKVQCKNNENRIRVLEKKVSEKIELIRGIGELKKVKELCKNCGNGIMELDQKFCEYCGVNLDLSKKRDQEKVLEGSWKAHDDWRTRSAKHYNAMIIQTERRMREKSRKSTTHISSGTNIAIILIMILVALISTIVFY